VIVDARLGLVVVGPLRDAGLSRISYRAAAAARRIRHFARRHGAAEGEVVAGYLTPTGEMGDRLLVAAPDGNWLDVMVADEAVLVTGLARVELVDRSDPSAARMVSIGRPFWEQMTSSW
jgi:hypothetical protein